MTASSFSHVSCCRAWRFRSRTDFIAAADDEQRGRPHRGELRPGQVRAAAAGDDRRDRHPRVGGSRPQCRGCARARPEVAQRDAAGGGMPAQPASDAGQPRRQQPHVEHAGAAEFLLGREQVGQQRAQASLVQGGGDQPVAGAAPAAAAAKGEDDRPGGPVRDGQVRCKFQVTGRQGDLTLESRRIRRHRRGRVSCSPRRAAAARSGGSPLQQRDGLFVSHIIGHGGLPWAGCSLFEAGSRPLPRGQSPPRVSPSGDDSPSRPAKPGPAGTPMTALQERVHLLEVRVER